MRYEYKYIVPCSKLEKLREMILPFVKSDPYFAKANQKGYTIRSIYYDTFHYQFYFEKTDGIKVRKKIRIRGYNEESPESIIFLEIKRRNEKAISKNRAPLFFKNLDSLMQKHDLENLLINDKSYNKSLDNARRFFYHINKLKLCPVILVSYEREAYFAKFNPSERITFDKGIRSSLSPDAGSLFLNSKAKHCIPNHFILEVKFHDVFPVWLSPILSMLKLRRTSFSKYTNCLDSHYPKGFSFWKYVNVNR